MSLSDPSGSSEFAQRRSHLSAAKQARLEEWLRGRSAKKAEGQQISKRTRQEYPPLSFVQQRLWFINQFEPGNVAYNVPTAMRLLGPLNIAVLEQSIQMIIARHEILRTTYRLIDGAPVQVIAPTLRLAIPLLDLSDSAEAEREDLVQQEMAREVQQPFDLSVGPLLSVSLLRLSLEEHILLISTHHTISDAWALGILIREWIALYEANCAGQPSPLPELPIQYADFAQWQREWLQGEVLEKQLTYWKGHLAGAATVLELPVDHPRPALQSYRGTSLLFMFPQALTERLKTFCVQVNSTLFQVLLAAFQTLLFRYSGQDDFLLGTPIANRTRLETENLIGVFVNTLVLRSNLAGNPTFRELVERVREETLEAYAHQDLPFEKLVELVQVRRDLSRNPLFQVMFVFQNNQVFSQKFAGLSLRFIRIKTVAVQFDLTLSMADTDEGMIGALEYNTDLFETATMERLVGHLQMLLERALANPSQRVGDLSLLTAAERQQLLLTWNETRVDYPLARPFHELFREQAARTPTAPALVQRRGRFIAPTADLSALKRRGRFIAPTADLSALNGERMLTYGELNARANQMSHLLRTLSVGPEVLVGIYMERSPEMVVAMLATWKAGGAYVPLDPAYPAERLSLILDDARPAVIVTQPRFIDFLPEQAAKVISLDPHWQALCGYSDADPACSSEMEQLAYVIYTSGSTGKPKGAMLNQRGMLNHLYAKIDDLQICASDRIAQTASHCFDISIWQFFSALLVGGQVEIFADEITHDPVLLLEELIAARITIVELVPSLLRALLDGATSRLSQLVDLRWLVATGEALPADLCRQWFEVVPSIPMVNAYGPTECSDDVTHMFIDRSSVLQRASAPIGRAIANTQLYLLDDALAPVPIGIPGQVYVGGSGVGRGYLNDPSRTASVFIPDPFATSPGTRLYKTGDLACYLPDGCIEFLGRIDHQVKLRGFRIELGEIEAALAEFPQVRESVVVLREDAGGTSQKRLVAYLVVEQEAALVSSEIRRRLQERLPDYMIPSYFVILASIPLTPNGKIDRQALPEPEEQHPELAVGYIAPTSQVERIIASVWQEVLHIDKVGLHDNFFDLGGHSLLMVQVLSKLQELLPGTALTMIELFRYPTISTLAEYARPAVAGTGQNQAPDSPASFSTRENRAQSRREAMQRLRTSRTRE